ncbi:MAG TPA: cupin domain-containing protein [Thermoanaerobaculia bacterium]|jgi:mannose-6-phosphate isomerase-like protein (cupin superfamily)
MATADDDTLTPVSIDNAEHYIWGQGCDGWRLLQGEQLSVIQERVPPGASETRHFHSRARQFFYVLAGLATLDFAASSVTFGAGQGVHVPPGIPHRFHNPSTEDVVFLVISAPTTEGDRTPA